MNKHIETPQCGFDRNASHAAGRYVCACGATGISAGEPINAGARGSDKERVGNVQPSHAASAPDDLAAMERRIAELENQQQAITALCNYAKVAHPSELLVKVGELEAQLDQSCNAEELRQVREENAALREDAERYRFIRDVPYSENIRLIMCDQSNAIMDAAIDAARKL